MSFSPCMCRSHRTLAPDLDGAKSNGGAAAFLVQQSHTQLMSLSAFGGMVCSRALAVWRY